MFASASTTSRRLGLQVHTIWRPYATHNRQIVLSLIQSMEDEQRKPDRNNFKIRAFRKAISEIDKLKDPVVSIEQLQQIEGIGQGITRRIQELLQVTVSHPQAQVHGPEDKQKAIQEFMRVPGVGPTKAKWLYASGCKSLQSLMSNEHIKKLPPSMRTAFFFMDHLDDHVSREQSEALRAIFEQELPETFRIDLVGNHRRGLDQASQIDILVTDLSDQSAPKPPSALTSTSTSTSRRKNKRTSSFKAASSAPQRAQSRLLTGVVAPLTRRGLLGGMFWEGPRRWEGVVRIPKHERYDRSYIFEAVQPRLDAMQARDGAFKRLTMTCVPANSSGAALIALTGDDEFLRHMRHTASEQGLLLTDDGLWQWRPSSADVSDANAVANDKDGSWVPLPSSDESTIFKSLGMDWVNPEKRNFEFVFGRK